MTNRYVVDAGQVQEMYVATISSATWSIPQQRILVGCLTYQRMIELTVATSGCMKDQSESAALFSSDFCRLFSVEGPGCGRCHEV